MFNFVLSWFRGDLTGRRFDVVKTQCRRCLLLHVPRFCAVETRCSRALGLVELRLKLCRSPRYDEFLSGIADEVL